jgi:5-methylcytosine-specific restriction protein A
VPWKPKTICSYPGCNELSHDRYCGMHKKRMNKERNSINSKIYNNQWRKASKTYLKENPLCVHCEKEDRLTPATEVDHIIPHGGDMKLFWDKSNWQTLCKKCHSIKTAKEDGGYGNISNSPRGF